MITREVLELVALDTLVFVLCAIRLEDGLVFAQILAALSAAGYSLVRIYDWYSKRKDD